LHGCDTYPLSLNEDILGVCENRVLRRVFGPKREEVAGHWRRLHNEEVHYFYTSPNIFKVIKLRRMRLVGYAAGIDKMRMACKNFDWKT
jgi:hypothetical protein